VAQKEQAVSNSENGSKKTRKWSKIPTDAEIEAFDGVHCKSTYREAVARNWRCPSCKRSAQELIRWSEIRGPGMRVRYGDEYGMGWTISMAKHHCHAGHRFPDTLICGECNAADGVAKRELGLPRDWSFSPEEIAEFVSVVPHSGKTEINYAKAYAIYVAELVAQRVLRKLAQAA
jgi:hypothetical protein